MLVLVCEFVGKIRVWIIFESVCGRFGQWVVLYMVPLEYVHNHRILFGIIEWRAMVGV